MSYLHEPLHLRQSPLPEMRTLSGQPQLVAIFIIALIVDRDLGLKCLLQEASLQTPILFDIGVTLDFLRITLLFLIILPIKCLFGLVLKRLLELAPEQILIN